MWRPSREARIFVLPWPVWYSSTGVRMLRAFISRRGKCAYGRLPRVLEDASQPDDHLIFSIGSPPQNIGAVLFCPQTPCPYTKSRIGLRPGGFPQCGTWCAGLRPGGGGWYNRGTRYD